jgi:hypothetical protein
MQMYVTKADGTHEQLDFSKIKRALVRAGAGSGLSDEVIEAIREDITQNISTQKIYKLAFEKLRELKPGAACRLGLKNALIKLGPDGYPFETFIGSLIKGRGYQSQLRQIIWGKCINHEVDVVATRKALDNDAIIKNMIECKFHNSVHLKCHIQSALYTWARFLDIKNKDSSFDCAWLVTNTKFSGDVIQYADCVGLKLLGWSFPQSESIQVRIEENKLYPITILPRLDRRTFEKLSSAEIITLKELTATDEQRLTEMGITRNSAQSLIREAKIILSKK